MAGSESVSGSAIAAQGLRVQHGRLRVMSENLANAQSTATTPGGDPYQRKIAVFAPVAGNAEPIGRVVRDTSPFRVIQSPGHPAADALGNLKLPNVDTAQEEAGMRAAMGTYESNMKVIATLGELDRRTIDLLKV
ncbi:flagellar basal body rod C-terminal domain-containing protein [Methylobacterium goesingense]|uniref:Flagellar basal-body rod protein FlgC n=1 Tax=Methylobacterium goesingense TaxID=243690 RepID=A0ABV2L2X3_9HYPH|nr:flagellar basal body rod C-terminal domain-containing protein [Methylobacterium goesingense]GJD76763.1 Flagellar basal-body rod protein FlgC [Methylobacterium goesingense]